MLFINRDEAIIYVSIIFLKLGILLAFLGNNEALTAADCTNPSKSQDTLRLLKQSVILITVSKPLLL